MRGPCWGLDGGRVPIRGPRRGARDDGRLGVATLRTVAPAVEPIQSSAVGRTGVERPGRTQIPSAPTRAPADGRATGGAKSGRPPPSGGRSLARGHPTRTCGGRRRSSDAYRAVPTASGRVTRGRGPERGPGRDLALTPTPGVTRHPAITAPHQMAVRQRSGRLPRVACGPRRRSPRPKWAAGGAPACEGHPHLALGIRLDQASRRHGWPFG